MVMKSVILSTIKIGNVKNDNHNDSNKINDNFYIVYNHLLIFEDMQTFWYTNQNKSLHFSKCITFEKFINKAP